MVITLTLVEDTYVLKKEINSSWVGMAALI